MRSQEIVPSWKRITPHIQDLIPNYVLRTKCISDRQMLAQFLQTYYQEVFPENPLLHDNRDYANQVVEAYFHAQMTPIFWVESADAYADIEQVTLIYRGEAASCLLMDCSRL